MGEFMSNINLKLEEEIFKVEKEKVDPLEKNKIMEILNLLKNIDHDLKPILNIIQRFIDESDDQTLNTLMIIKLLKFYGINNKDILTVRQKMLLVDRELVKVPYLKKNQVECINILLKSFNFDF
jgi:hypothetical protein